MTESPLKASGKQSGQRKEEKPIPKQPIWLIWDIQKGVVGLRAIATTLAIADAYVRMLSYDRITETKHAVLKEERETNHLYGFVDWEETNRKALLERIQLHLDGDNEATKWVEAFMPDHLQKPEEDA